MLSIPPRVARRLRRALPIALVVATLGVTQIDDYASYDGQVDCARNLPSGTAYLAAHLPRQYGGSVVSTLRACDDGVSEHKDGRAIDWAADATRAGDRARVQRLLGALFATDAQGNPHALARRMGIMYLIWNDTIYRAYDGFQPGDYRSGSCSSLKTCSTTLRHRDHVHISLSRAGAAAQTSFFRGRDVTPQPVFLPGTRILDASATARLPITVPADGAPHRTPYKLQAGTTYRLVADGRFRYGAGTAVSDAACAWSDTTDTWAPSPAGLVVGGVRPWSDQECAAGPSRVTDYTPTRTGPLTLSAGDGSAWDNAGALTVWVARPDVPLGEIVAPTPRAASAPRMASRPGARAPRLRKETVVVPADRAAGRRTVAGLRRGASYKVFVTGVARSGATPFDGRCVWYAGRLREQFSLDLARPADDHLGVYIQGSPVSLKAARTSRDCTRTNRYVGRFRAPVSGRASIRIFDPFAYSDNSGALRVTMVRRG